VISPQLGKIPFHGGRGDSSGASHKQGWARGGQGQGRSDQGFTSTQQHQTT